MIENAVTDTPLQLSLNAEDDWLQAVEFGVVIDGKPEDETIPGGEDFGYFLDEPDGAVIGFWVHGISGFRPDELNGPIWEGPRFRVPVLGLQNACAGEVILSARATFAGMSSADSVFFKLAVGEQGSDRAEIAWRACLAAGNLRAHFALGYTLCEQGRYHEAYGHLRLYTELCPKNSWAWCWLGQACAAKGDFEEARDAYCMAIDLERIGSFETNAIDLLAEVWEPESDPAEVDGTCGS